MQTREDPAEDDLSEPASESDVTERLTNLSMKKKVGKIPLVDSSMHMDVSKSLMMTDADLPFQPFSAALRNLKDKESLLSPAALASRDPDMMTPLQQACPSSLPYAILRRSPCVLLLNPRN